MKKSINARSRQSLKEDIEKIVIELSKAGEELQFYGGLIPLNSEAFINAYYKNEQLFKEVKRLSAQFYRQ